MLRKLRERIQSEEKGFTLIELLVVILIIGILAAIAIPAFLSQTDKADDASVKSGARNAQTAAETYNVDKGGTYAGMTEAALKAIEPTLSEFTVTVNSASGTAYSVTASKAGITNTFSVNRNGGVVNRSCKKAGTGGCQTGTPGAGAPLGDDGVW